MKEITKYGQMKIKLNKKIKFGIDAWNTIYAQTKILNLGIIRIELTKRIYKKPKYENYLDSVYNALYK